MEAADTDVSRFRGSHRLESVEDSTDLEVRLLALVFGYDAVITVDVMTPDGETQQLVLDLLSETYEQRSDGRTYVLRLLSGTSELEREVTILIPTNGGKATVSVPY